MALSPEQLLALVNETRAKVNEIQEAAYLVYAELWAHYRSLIIALGSSGVSNAERLEHEAQLYFETHHERLVSEGLDRIEAMMGKRRPPTLGSLQ